MMRVPIIHSILRICAGLIGVSLLFAAFFLHEDEEGNLQNRLLEAWVRADDLQRRFLSHQAALISRATQMALTALDRVFGERAFSWQRVRALIVLTASSTALALPVYWTVDDVRHHKLSPMGTVGWSVTAAGLVLLVIGLAPAWSDSRAVKVIQLVAAIGIGVGVPLYFATGGVVDMFSTLAVFAIGAGIDILFIGFLRWLLRKVIRADRASTMVAGLILCATAGLALNLPLYFFGDAAVGGMIGDAMGAAFGGGGQESLTEQLVTDAAMIFATNTFDAACSLLIVVLVGGCLLHRLFWPLVERPIYAAHRHGLLANRKLLGSVGFSGLLFAMPGWMTPLIAFVAKQAK